MSTVLPKCSHCLDTGSLSKRLDAEFLDCVYCDTALKRVEFNKWARVFIQAGADAAMWAAYQRGRIAGLEEAKNGHP